MDAGPHALRLAPPKENLIMTDKNAEAPIYLDHNATTPIDPDALRAMMPFLTEEFGNPSSGYSLGKRAHEAMDHAREAVADLLNCQPREIVFTSGGSESNNMVLKGVVDLTNPQEYHIITSAIEHPAILNPALFLMELGVKLTILPVDRLGHVDPDDVRKAISPLTVLITLMLANNETGALQPMREISKIASEHGVPLHTDAAQAVGKIPVDVGDLRLDFLSVAGHKLYGPKGVGALYIRDGRSLTPLIHGAAQEDGRRAGTENVVLAAGLGAACRVASERLQKDAERIGLMRDHLQDLLFEEIHGLALNGPPEDRLPNTLNVSVPGLEGAKILDAIPSIMASTGAACHDRAVKLSHVLSAMSVPPEVGMGALRLTLGRGSTMEQIETAARQIIQQVKRMRHED
jgi:cysteine desulfurase